MKKTFPILFLAGLANAASLPLALIPQIGWVIGKYPNNVPERNEKWSLGGFEVGAKASYNFPDTKFYLEPGIYYSYVEGKYKDKIFNEKKEGYHFLKLPVGFLYKAYKDDDFSFKAGLGPYLAYNLDKNKDTEMWDLGLSLEGSLVYIDRFVLGVRFDLGLKDLNKNEDIKVKSKVFVINLGYKFDFFDLY